MQIAVLFNSKKRTIKLALVLALVVEIMLTRLTANTINIGVWPLKIARRVLRIFSEKIGSSPLGLAD